jgi:myo-inositol-1(or 4)-monophosphatase
MAINIFGKETGLVENNTGTSLCWIVNPLDGRLNYERNIPLYCTSVALWDGKKPILGVVYDYAHDSLYKGVVGEGAFLNDAAINVSQVTQLSQAVIATGFTDYSSLDTEALSSFMQYLQSYKEVRFWGSAAFSMMMVAKGAIEVYLENDVAWWNVAAGIAIVLAAGGFVEYDFIDREKYLMRVLALNHIRLI